MVGPHKIPLEAVSTMIEMADVAWTALEFRRERKAEAAEAAAEAAAEVVEEEELARLRSENLRLRNVLSDNLAVLQKLYNCPAVASDCPPDLYERLVAAVESSSFRTKLEALHQETTAVSDGKIYATGVGLDCVDVMIDANHGEPSWWVWVTHEIVPENLEEVSGIDNENYVVISEENVVDGISNFLAICILENPKSKIMTPEELQRTVARALGGFQNKSKWKHYWEAGKIIYSLSTWGLALAGLWRHRAVVKAVAKGAHAGGKLILKAL